MLKKIIFTTVLSVAVALPAFADLAHEPTPPASSPAPQPPAPPHGKGYFVCSAHNTDDDFWLHYGDAMSEKCDAEESAIKVCEEFEKQECEVHDCRFFIH
jgi:hypothetical protein